MFEVFFSQGILILVMICLYFSLKNNKKNKASYDEMQNKIRNNAYKYCLFSLLCFNLLVCLLEQFNLKIFDTFTTTSFVGTLIALFAFAFVCIKNDSYIAIYENFKVKVSLFFIIGIINTLFFIYSLINNSLIVLNFFTFNICYGLVGFIFIFLGVFLLIKNKEAERED